MQVFALLAPMTTAPLDRLVRHCDRLLQPEQFNDWPGAANGLQVENSGRVRRLAAAVDATLTTVQMAVDAGADLLLAHHGLFWNPTTPWTGPRYRLLRLLLDHDLAVYSAHLPLDAHPRLGNNALLAAALGFRRTEPFFLAREAHLGVRVNTRLKRDTLRDRVAAAVNGPVTVLPAGPEVCRKVGIVSGGAGDELRQAAAEGVDTFITGEGPHWTFPLAEELGLNVLYAGHYATETFGVKALAQHLAGKFRLPWVFLDHPSGL
jgi:dinuclear metal center YbgI/SA1388 family protein